MANMKKLNELRSLFKAPLLTHRWEIEISTWPKALSPSGVSSEILFMVQSSGVPSIDESEVTVQLGGFTMNFNGKQNRNGSLDWTLPENIDMAVANFFYEYEKKRQHYNSNNDISIFSEVDDDLIIPSIKMRLWDPSGTKTVCTYELINCYFRAASFTGELAQDADVSNTTVTVVYDSWVMTPGG